MSTDSSTVINNCFLTLDRPLPYLVPVETGSVGSHDQDSVTHISTDILGITIHGTDALKASVNISHPCIRVTVVDSSLEPKGALAKKSQPDRCVTSFYERGNPSVDYIMPILTQPFNCSQHRYIWSQNCSSVKGKNVLERIILSPSSF